MVSYIVFSVGEQKFIYETEKVVETVKVDRIFPVPKSPDYLRGVINLRNNVIPVIDTGKLLWDTPLEGDTLLIVEEEDGIVGLLVSRVVGIISVEEEDLADVKEAELEDVKEEFIRGILDYEGGILILLNLKPVIKKRAKKAKKSSKKKKGKSLDISEGLKRLEDTEGFVIFSLGKEWFAIPVDNVREVVDYPSSVAQLPKTPDYIEGVFLLRDKELILYSMKRFLCVDSDRQEKRVVVLNVGSKSLGAAVDDVREIRWVSKNAILQVEGASSKGVIALEGGSKLVLILDVEELGKEDYSQEIAQEEVHAEVKPMKNFVRFSINDIDMAVPIEKVKEVVELSGITPLPNSPDYVEGMFNLRNSVIVIISLCKRLGLSCNENSNRVIVLEDFPVGIKVSNLKGIFKTEEENIQPAEGVSEPEEEFLEGIIKTDEGGIVFILSPEKVVKDEDISLLEEQEVEVDS